MTKQVRRLATGLAFLLMACVAMGTALPSSAWVWQCRHASRLVAAPLPAPNAMPCAMPHPATAMSCCQAMSSAHGPLSRLAAPACRPALSRLAAAAPAAWQPAKRILALGSVFCAALPGTPGLAVPLDARPTCLRPLLLCARPLPPPGRLSAPRAPPVA